MTMTQSVRYGALGLAALLAAGLFWLGIGRVQAERRALAAAAPVESVESVEEIGAGGVGGEPPVNPSKLAIHVAGAVVSPGIHWVEEGARVDDAVTAAGGPLPSGEPQALNLAAPLMDGDKVYVPSREEVKEQALPSPAAQQASHVPVTATQSSSGTLGSSGASGSSSTAGGGTATNVRVSINRATVEELTQIKGIGPKKAQAIVEYRSQNGPFQQIEDLTQVKGIGDATLEKMRPYLTL